MKLLQKIERKQEEKQKCLAVLLDPDKVEMKGIMKQVETYVSAGVDLFLVGGSLISGNNFYILVEALRRQKEIPVVIFPGSNLHIHNEADAILLLSLISGRNPELLIGQHVIAAPILKNSGLEILPTGYMLIESGKPTTVSYISNTQPIPADKEDIAVCTAMAGEMLGLRLLYLDGGSGAINPVPPKMISAVRRNTGLPIIVGGGITSGLKAEQAWLAGAGYLVIGNGLEKEPELLEQIIKVRNRLNMPAGALA